MPDKTRSPGQPQQARSKATLERILNATERLLVLKNFSDITVAELVENSASSIGAFYKRFSSKAELLPYLLERLQQRQLESIREFVASGHWQDVGLQDRARQFTHILAHS